MTVSSTISSCCWIAFISMQPFVLPTPQLDFGEGHRWLRVAKLWLPSCPALLGAISSIPSSWPLPPSIWIFVTHLLVLLLTSWAALSQSSLYLSLPDLWGPILLFLDDLTQVHDFKYHLRADGSQIYVSVLTSVLSSRHIDLIWHLHLDDSRHLKPDTLRKDFILQPLPQTGSHLGEWYHHLLSCLNQKSRNHSLFFSSLLLLLCNISGPHPCLSIFTLNLSPSCHDLSHLYWNHFRNGFPSVGRGCSREGVSVKDWFPAVQMTQSVLTRLIGFPKGKRVGPSFLSHFPQKQHFHSESQIKCH